MIAMIHSLLESNKTFASPVILWLVDQHGPDALSFEPETVAEALYAVNPKTRRGIVDRVNAGLGLLSSDLFWTDPFVFGMVCRTLSRHKFPTANAPSTLDLAWGITEAAMLVLEDSEGVGISFSSGVKTFIQSTVKSDGLLVMPAALKNITKVAAEFRLDDPEIYAARQQEADADAANIDAAISGMIIELFKQIKSLRMDITSEAAADIDAILGA